MKFDEGIGAKLSSTGDIEGNKVSIDVNNIDFIVMILSSNLYSDSIGSFLRETISNAWDSHMEAGVVDPVVLEIGKDHGGQYYCQVQDFGVGLSPQRFHDVYINIGSSTKRNTNGQIGGFGIGKFAALAYTEVVNITSRFDGKEYQYLMYKEGDKVSIDLLNTIDTTERNGLTVRVSLADEGEMSLFSSAIKKQLSYFDNLYLRTNFLQKAEEDNLLSEEDLRGFENYAEQNFYTFAQEFNSMNIYDYTHFKACDGGARGKIHIILGKVAYPIDFASLKEGDNNYHHNSARINDNYEFKRTLSVGVKFDIGELQVTPNREQIRYSDEAIKLINNRLEATCEEILKLEEKICSTEIATLPEVIENCRTLTKYLDLADNVSTKITSERIMLTFEGRVLQLNVVKNIVDTIESHALFRGDKKVEGGSLVNLHSHISIRGIKEGLRNDGNKIFIGENKFNMRDKYFLRNYTYNMRFYKPVRVRDLKFLYGLVVKRFPTRLFPIAKRISKFYLAQLKNLPKYTSALITKEANDDYDGILAERKARTVRIKNAGPKDMNIKFLRKGKNSSAKLVLEKPVKVHFKDVPKNYHNQIVFGTSEDKENLEKLYMLLTYNKNLYDPKLSFGIVPKNQVKYLKGILGIMEISQFIKKREHRRIKQINTALYILENYPTLKLDIETNVVGKFSRKHEEVLNKVYNYISNAIGHNWRNSYYKMDELHKEIFGLFDGQEFLDLEIIGTLEGNINFINNLKIFKIFKSSNNRYGHSVDKDKINLFTDYLIARKIFMPGKEAILKLKKETIYNNPIKEEDENN